MLERYFLRPKTVDRIRASWIAEPIERYVSWLTDRRYRAATIRPRVPILIQFGDFAAAHGATRWDQLPAQLSLFMEAWLRERRPGLRRRIARGDYAWEIRRPIEQMLQLVVPGFDGSRPRPHLPVPFSEQAPGFFQYLRSERGLREATVQHYLHFLRRFERHLRRIGRGSLRALRPRVLREFVQEHGHGLSHSSISGMCDVLRVFLRYIHRERIIDRDLSTAVDRPQAYRLAKIPRSISWQDAERMLRMIDRRSAVGRRDYAMMLLVMTYGLRAREVAALKLDDINWRGETLRVPERKGGHSTRYPLSPTVGEALLEYVEHGRPTTEDRHLFFRAAAPSRPLPHHAVSQRAAHYLKQAGIRVPRRGSHTLRHTVVQRLLDADFSLKEIGDYVGHRSPDSTEIYAKVDLARLREVALGNGEEVL